MEVLWWVWVHSVGRGERWLSTLLDPMTADVASTICPVGALMDVSQGSDFLSADAYSLRRFGAVGVISARATASAPANTAGTH